MFCVHWKVRERWPEFVRYFGELVCAAHALNFKKEWIQFRVSVRFN